MLVYSIDYIIYCYHHLLWYRSFPLFDQEYSLSKLLHLFDISSQFLGLISLFSGTRCLRLTCTFSARVLESPHSPRSLAPFSGQGFLEEANVLVLVVFTVTEISASHCWLHPPAAPGGWWARCPWSSRVSLLGLPLIALSQGLYGPCSAKCPHLDQSLWLGHGNLLLSKHDFQIHLYSFVCLLKYSWCIILYWFQE